MCVAPYVTSGLSDGDGSRALQKREMGASVRAQRRDVLRRVAEPDELLL